MKKAILAAVAGFSVAFVAGVVSAPEAAAQVLRRCASNSACYDWGITYCGAPGVCDRDSGSIPYCICP